MTHFRFFSNTIIIVFETFPSKKNYFLESELLFQIFFLKYNVKKHVIFFTGKTCIIVFETLFGKLLKKYFYEKTSISFSGS